MKDRFSKIEDFVMLKIVIPIFILVFIGLVFVGGALAYVKLAYVKPQCLEKGFAGTEVTIGFTAYCTKRVNGTDVIEKL